MIEYYPSAEDMYAEKENRDRVLEALNLLTDREKYVLERRMGLGENPKEMTLKALSEELGVGPSRVRQIQFTALSQIREMIESPDGILQKFEDMKRRKEQALARYLENEGDRKKERERRKSRKIERQRIREEQIKLEKLRQKKVQASKIEELIRMAERLTEAFSDGEFRVMELDVNQEHFNYLGFVNVKDDDYSVLFYADSSGYNPNWLFKDMKMSKKYDSKYPQGCEYWERGSFLCHFSEMAFIARYIQSLGFTPLGLNENGEYNEA
jgi:hypothetical protein